MDKKELIELARCIASEHKLWPELVCAIIEQESEWNPWAVNPEPHYRYIWDFAKKKPFRKLLPEEIASEKPPSDFTAPAHVDRDAEWWCQQMSWGLMQVMGGVARERGFTGKFLTELCAPSLGLEIGCQHFSIKLAQAELNVAHALQLWNGGGNPNYASEVLDRAKKYKV